MTKPQFLDDQISALGRVSIGTWGLVVTLIVTLAGWGYATRSNAAELREQKATISVKADKDTVDRKIDKDLVNQQFNDIVRRLDELKEDIREVRHEQERQRQWGKNNKPSNSLDSSGTH